MRKITLQFFGLFRKLPFGRMYPFAFIADFGWKKVVLQAEEIFAIMGLFQKIQKIEFFVIRLINKWFPSLKRISWVTSCTEIVLKV